MWMRSGFAWGVGAALALLILAGEADARGGRLSGRAVGPGLGSNPRSYGVGPHLRRDGTFVSPHRRSTPNREWRDNWSTSPNTNPDTGRIGTHVTPPQK